MNNLFSTWVTKLKLPLKDDGVLPLEACLIVVSKDGTKKIVERGLTDLQALGFINTYKEETKFSNSMLVFSYCAVNRNIPTVANKQKRLLNKFLKSFDSYNFYDLEISLKNHIVENMSTIDGSSNIFYEQKKAYLEEKKLPYYLESSYEDLFGEEFTPRYTKEVEVKEKEIEETQIVPIKDNTVLVSEIYSTEQIAVFDDGRLF